MRTGDSVVPIGGAPFVPPYSKIRPIDTNAASSSSYPSYSPTFSSFSPTNMTFAPFHSSDSTGEVISPSSSFSSNSSKSSIGNNSPQLEAALRYSSAIHLHTRKMWEKERSTIEKSKFDSRSSFSGGSGGGGDDSNAITTSSNSGDDSSQGKESITRISNRRSSLGSALGVDLLWSRKKRHSKTLTDIY